MKVACVIVTDEPLPPGAVVRVVVEDVTMADIPARTVAERVLPARSVGPGPVLVSVAEVDPRVHYAVRVHVDAERSGSVSRGDLVSTAAHPVLTFGHPSSVRVPLQRVP
jgi:Type III secretion system lipoprotein chaperone (YscW)